MEILTLPKATEAASITETYAITVPRPRVIELGNKHLVYLALYILGFVALSAVVCRVLAIARFVYY